MNLGVLGLGGRKGGLLGRVFSDSIYAIFWIYLVNGVVELWYKLVFVKLFFKIGIILFLKIK